MKKQTVKEQPKTTDPALQELNSLLETGAIREDAVPVVQNVVQPTEEQGSPDWVNRSPEEKSLDWKKKKVEVKTTVVRCIVIDRNDRWHEGARVDLHGMDTGGFTWGYYGTTFPVLVEDDQGRLNPWYLPDAAGESSNRLFKGANPEGFRNTFRHRSTILQKIQVGLMVVLALGLFFIMFIMLNQ